MRICVFEDEGVWRLEPLTLTRPACDLWCGASPLLDRHGRYFAATEVGLLVRPFLADLCRLLHPQDAVNDLDWLRGSRTLLVNARWLPPDQRPAEALDVPRVALVDNQVAYLVVPLVDLSDCSIACLTERISAWRQTLPQIQAGGRMMDHSWDLVSANAEALGQDFKRCRREQKNAVGSSRPIVIGPDELLWVDPEASIEPLAVVDTTRGPVLVDSGAVVQAFSRLEGPCYVGPGSRILGAKVRSSTVGPLCRVGGEVEASILQGYSNKCHDGFLGHSYVGAWVNLAAGTQVSDLRNDYGPVGVVLAGEKVDTGLTKVGAFLGDHTKTGLNTLLNTGTVVGAFCHLLPGGGLLPKVIPSFCTFASGRLQERADFRELFTTAATVLQRRGQVWTDAHAEFFLSLYEHTAAQRRQVLSAAEQRRGWRSASP